MARNPNAGRPGYRNNGLIDWRAGGVRHKKPRAYQARRGGPPLLFMTDIRMTVLVTLAISPTPYRLKSLEDFLEVPNLSPCINELTRAGLLVSWWPNQRTRIIALDPCHPCYEGMVILLRRIGERYRFKSPLYLSENLFGGAAPKRLARKRDARLTFGTPQRTLALLAIRVLESASINDVARALKIFERKTIATTLWRFASFGILTATNFGGRRGVSFSLNPQFEFSEDLLRIIDCVGVTLAVWRCAIEHAPCRVPVRSSGERRRQRTSNQQDAALRRWSQVRRKARMFTGPSATA